LILCLFTLLIPAFAQSRSVAVIAHRGEHLSHTENTLPAFQAAIEAGADYFELDVRTTSDGKLVLMHDATVDRTTNGKGRVSELTFDDIRALRAGSEVIPTFEEALALARGRIQVYVDCKQISVADLIATLEKSRMLERVVVYGGLDFLKQVQALRPQVRVMPEAVSLAVVRRIVEELKPRVIAFDARDWQDEVIAVARQAGADRFVDRLGPADQPAAWQDAIDRGATGIQTDHPARLVEFLRARSLHK